MPTITLKGVPLKLYRELKKRAVAERRSLNAETIRRLEESMALPTPAARDPEGFLARVRERQLKYNTPPISNDEITASKHFGRK